MENNQQNIVSESSNQSVQTGAGSSATPAKKIGLGQKAQLFFKKYQYINGKKMAAGEAEQAARKDLNLPLLTNEELQKINEDAKKPGVVSKIIDSKALQAVGLSKLIHEKMDWAVKDEQQKNVENENNLVEQKGSDDKSEF